MASRTELFGTEEAEPEVRTVTVGDLSFELVGGQIGAVRFGGAEVLRGIAWLVRDRDWGTPFPRIAGLHVEQCCQRARVTYIASCRNPEGERLDYAAVITATPTTLDFIVEADARADFATNRTGFCVFHPAELAGTPLSVEHGDGTIEESRFPVLIDPWQPFTDMKALTHRQAGVEVACRLEGDSFEMEDQRNWSDASYKTYVRPLARPWPYVLPAGTRDRQSVSLRIEGVPPAARGEGGPVEIAVGDAVGVMPRIGMAVTPDQADATAAQAGLLAASGVQDLLLSFDASAGHGAEEMWALACAAAGSKARLTLECVIAADGDLHAELAQIARHVAATGLALDAVAVFPRPDLQSTPPGSSWPDCPPFEAIFATARLAFPGLRLGGGMYGYFTELNRKRAPAELIDFVSHATCPIVHAADDRSVMQSLAAVRHIVRSARALYPESVYRLGPITIGMRQNPYGSRTMSNPDRTRMAMATVDPRQDGAFAAAWTIGYAAATEEAELGAVVGPLGAIGDAGPRPVFEAIRLLAALAGQPRRACTSSEPDEVAALCAGGTLVLANLTAEDRTVRAAGEEIGLAPFEIRSLALG
jgi:hypothetical protein